MKYKHIILSSLALMVFALSAYSIDLNSTKAPKLSDVDTNLSTDNNNTINKIEGSYILADNSDNFEKRFVYFDRSLSDDENFELVKKVIKDANKLGFNGLVLSQEYIYTRLSHKNPIIDKVKVHMQEIEKLAHENNLELIPMHFRANVVNTVIKDNDENNKYYRKDGFDFSEANKAITLYEVNGTIARVAANPHISTSTGLLDSLYTFTDIKANTEYKITIDATTDDFEAKEIKVSVLDGDYAGENGKVIFGVHKYFTNIKPTKEHGKYSIYFNTLDHKNQKGKVKVYVQDNSGVTIHSVSLLESGYNKKIHVKREQNKVIVTSEDENRTYQSNKDYTIDDDGINILSEDMKKEKFLKVTWYPRVATSLPKEQRAFSDICADEDYYYEILLDQMHTIKRNFNEHIDALAIDDDEWRAAGWNEKCKEIYAKEFNSTDENFTGGDYIGISTKRMIERFTSDLNRSNMQFYLMSDMFDPNFNQKTPYMGVKTSPLRSDKYLPKKNVVMFNWFPNPYEPGLEDKKEEDFLKSAKHFSDLGLKQIIAGYHDDMRNLDSNFAFYNKSDKKTQKSIIGFMYLIWFQPDKNATYDDMAPVVKRICEELPGKWPQDVCKELEK